MCGNIPLKMVPKNEYIVKYKIISKIRQVNSEFNIAFLFKGFQFMYLVIQEFVCI